MSLMSKHQGDNFRPRLFWLRNYYLLRANPLPSIFWMFLEPLLLLVAIGYGLGRLIPQMGELYYIEFFSPALVVGSGMLVSFQEATHGSFQRIFKENLMNTYRLSPLRSSDLVLGEFLWSSSKGFLSSFFIFAFCCLIGSINITSISYFVPFILLNAVVFASLGLLVTAFSKKGNGSLYFNGLVVLPMFLFGGTFFPTNIFPYVLDGGLQLLPYVHAVEAARAFAFGSIGPSVVLNISVMALTLFTSIYLFVPRLLKRIDEN